MSRLKNLYTYLITNRRSHVDGWLTEYQTFTKEVATVRSALNQGKHLKENDTYTETKFSTGKIPWEEFVGQLLRSYNGVSGVGQSVLSYLNFEKFIKDDNFVTSLENLIKTPNRLNFYAFGDCWKKLCDDLKANQNHLLINRTLAACTLDVTSTVNASSFESVYWWLVNELLIPPCEDQSANWYDKNIHLMTRLRTEFKDELDKTETSDHLLSIFVWQLYENISNPFSLKKQVIKYGAPGTGKTYTAKVSTRLLFDIWREEFGMNTAFTHEKCCQTVQFHPSFGYEDFMEGLRPKLDPAGKAQLTLQNGIFKNLCIEAGAWERDVYAIPNCGHSLSEKWQAITIVELKSYRDYLKGPQWDYIFSHFAPSKKISDAVPPFFFIIDEINRAELSRVLGELMICLEYRGTEGAISTQYAALNTADTGMLAVGDGFKFFIPHNVYVIGTMNTIDRSVESFDLALRRRFRWERMDPDIVALRYHLKVRDAKLGTHPWVGLADDLENLNQLIAKTDLLGEDYQIGHAYLMNLRYSSDLNRSQIREKVWEDNIQPLLEEYLRGSGRSGELLPDFKKAFGVT